MKKIKSSASIATKITLAGAAISFTPHKQKPGLCAVQDILSFNKKSCALSFKSLSFIRTMAKAALLTTGVMAAPMFAEACDVDSAMPFNSGPLDPTGTQMGYFSEYIVDSNGVALQICTDGDGASPCFFDLPVQANALSEALGRGGEAFFFLANNAGTTTGAFPINWTIVMGVESAFLSPEPTPGFQTQFQRLRTRVNVSSTGIYTVETPWGKSVHRVDTLLPPGNGQNRSEISTPIDISFGPDTSVTGVVTPFLIAVNKPGLAVVKDKVTGLPVNQADYIGDGLTPTEVTGSPCGANFVKITAVALDGVSPININNGSNVIINKLFTVMGKIEPKAKVPLSIGATYYNRKGGQDSVTVMATGSTSATQAALMKININDVSLTLDKDFNRFYGTQPVSGALPATISVTATDTGKPSIANTLDATLKDLVTIDKAVANCKVTNTLSDTGTVTSTIKTCDLTVQAASSDDGSVTDQPVTLRLQHPEAFLSSCGPAPTIQCPIKTSTILTSGVPTTVTTTAGLPAEVTVVSNKGGVAVNPSSSLFYKKSSFSALLAIKNI